jgi:hypothetical protein
MTVPWTTGERVFLRYDGKLTAGVIRLSLAGGRLLRIELSNGRRIWRQA